MDASELAAACEGVVRDIAETTGMHIEVSPGSDPAEGMFAVVHVAGRHPVAPVWEAVGLLAGGDALGAHAACTFPDGVRIINGNADFTHNVAGAAQDLVQVLLWQQGLDPTWPACPEHQGHHPLRAVLRSVTLPESDPPGSVVDLSVWWQCPAEGSVRIPIGSLAVVP